VSQQVLLDTHVWIWWVTGQDDLSSDERLALGELAERGRTAISAITLWEAQMLHSKGRLKLDLPFGTWILQAAAPAVVQLYPLDTAVILAINELPTSFHGDPADRVIVATARAHELRLATHDGRIRRSRLARLWKP
jgi:PIN domain nuclease of toxin-antitoxin system